MARTVVYMVVGAVALAILWSGTPQAQVTPDLQQKIDMMVRLCVAGGQQFKVTGGGSGGAEISLRAFDVKGNLKGDIHVDKSQAEGLVNGIDNAISQIAANEVDKVRECLKPVRDRVLDILFPPQARPSLAPPQPPKYLLLSLYMTADWQITGAVDRFVFKPITFYKDQRTYKVYSSVYYDKGSHTKFISIYVPAGQDLVDLLSALIEHVGEFLDHSLQNPFMNLQIKMQGESASETFASFPFSGRIYIYYEGTLEPEELRDLSRAYKAKGMAAEFRGNDYMLATWSTITAGIGTAPPEFAIEDDAICRMQRGAEPPCKKVAP